MKIKISKIKFNMYIWCAIFVFIGIFFLYYLFIPHGNNLDKYEQKFLTEIEYKTFDLRQKMISKFRKPNDDIVIINIDDKTYEAVIEKFGSWPIPRYIYPDVIDYLESQHPKIIAFDILFVGDMKDGHNSNEKLGEMFKKYNNLYTVDSFDDMDKALREPKSIDDRFSVSVNSKTKIFMDEYANHRAIIKNITDVTSNIGNANVDRSSDGIFRTITPFVKYQNKYYPHLAFLISQRLLNAKTKNIEIKNGNLNFDNNSYPITLRGEMFLNWYNNDVKKTTEDEKEIDIYNSFPLWRVVLATEQYKQGKEISKEYKYDFKDKIIYIAASSPDLHDIKPVPVSERLAGVGLHATFINNMLDNSFIKKVSFWQDFLIAVLMSLFIGFVTLKIEASKKIYYKYMIPLNITILLSSIFLYYLFSTYVLMYKFNLWVAVVMPTVGMMLTFMIVYITKYFFKSKDYEYTYRLATTDGLTDLYNHRYFQEQMLLNVETAKRYNTNFSMILTDIDFFKKFNDKFGHQSGDAVLRQVAKLLKKNVRNIDMVCRYGGEEMSIILPNTDNKSAMIVAQKLCDIIASSIFQLANGAESHVTISLGVSTYPENGITPAELIEYADKGLYVAKENGRNQVGVVKNS